jgi:hypothetical protein
MPKGLMTPSSLISQAQLSLDKLFNEGQIPFKLTADKVDRVGADEYIVRFYDRRLRSVDVSWQEGEPFEDVFRVAVLSRVKRLSGPLTSSLLANYHARQK